MPSWFAIWVAEQWYHDLVRISPCQTLLTIVFEDLIGYEVQQVEPLKIKERIIEDGTQILREPETTARAYYK